MVWWQENGFRSLKIKAGEPNSGLNRLFLTKNNFIDMVQVHIKKFFFTVYAMILFEGGPSLLGGPVQPHSSHIPKTTTVCKSRLRREVVQPGRIVWSQSVHCRVVLHALDVIVWCQ